MHPTTGPQSFFDSTPQAARAAWNEALDTLVGPYQVIGCWRQQLGDLTQKAALEAYGLHGLLLSGAILCGKLARCEFSSRKFMFVAADNPSRST